MFEVHKIARDSYWRWDRRSVREPNGRVVQYPSYAAAADAAAALAKTNPWARYEIACMRMPGQTAQLHAQRLAAAALARRIGDIWTARKAVSSARRVRIGLE